MSRTESGTPVRVMTATTCAAAVPTRRSGGPDHGVRRGWASVGAIALGAFIVVMTETLPVGLLPRIARGLGVELGPAGLIVLAPGFTAAVSAPARSARNRTAGSRTRGSNSSGHKSS